MFFYKILICDDSPIDRKLLIHLLGQIEACRFDCREAGKAEEISAALAEKKFDLIFLDLRLPERSGLDWLAEIASRKLAPVVMLTGSGDKKDIVTAMRSGAADYLLKEDLFPEAVGLAVDGALELWRLTTERDLLLGTATHEIRNPLAGIAMYLEILAKNWRQYEPAKVDQLIDSTRQTVRELLEMLGELLDLEKIKKGTVSLELAPVGIGELLKEKYDFFLPQAENKSISLALQPVSESLVIEADRQRLGEVLDNYISNALKYSPAGAQVTIAAERCGDDLRVKVTDTGPGIAAEELDRLFVAFSDKKVSSRPTGGERSTGLGLAICKKIIELHGGQVGVDSQLGKGSAFWFNIPLRGKKN